MVVFGRTPFWLPWCLNPQTIFFFFLMNDRDFIHDRLLHTTSAMNSTLSWQDLKPNCQHMCINIKISMDGLELFNRSINLQWWISWGWNLSHQFTICKWLKKQTLLLRNVYSTPKLLPLQVFPLLTKESNREESRSLFSNRARTWSPEWLGSSLLDGPNFNPQQLKPCL